MYKASTKVSPELTVNVRLPVAAPPGAVAKHLILAAVLFADPVLTPLPPNKTSVLPLDHEFAKIILAPLFAKSPCPAT